MDEQAIIRELKEQRDEFKEEVKSLREQLVEKETKIATLTSEKANKESMTETLSTEAETMKKSLIESEEKITSLTEELNSFKYPEDFSRPEWDVLMDVIEDLQYILGDYKNESKRFC